MRLPAIHRVRIFIVGLSVMLTVITGSVTVVGYLAYPERRVEAVLTDSVTTIGWIGLLALAALVVLYCLDEFFDDLVILLPLSAGYYIGHRYFGLPAPDIDKPTNGELEILGWLTTGYVGLVLVGGLVLIGYLTQVAACSACGDRVPRKANFCPSCGRTLSADRAVDDIESEPHQDSH